MDYTKPDFSDNELKWIAKNNGAYCRSLAPVIGESQFEYRERLKWEFAENNKFKKVIKNAIELKKEEEKRKKREEERIKQLLKDKRIQMEYMKIHGGGYCNYDCKYFYEEYFDSNGGVVADLYNDGYVEYKCMLGFIVSEGRFCVYYDR